jgi:hypothetical protein
MKKTPELLRILVLVAATYASASALARQGFTEGWSYHGHRRQTTAQREGRRCVGGLPG